MVIYLTTNKINGKQYIGLDTKNNPGYLGSGKILKQSIQKYGKDNFEKIILEKCKDFNELKEKEKYWISYYDAVNSDNFYNITEGGVGGDCYSGLTEKDKSRNRMIKSENAKKNNIMHKKSVYECWVDKYGVYEANKRLELKKLKHSEYSSKTYELKKEKTKELYSDFIIENYEKLTLDDLHKKLNGLVSKKLIKVILKENGVNLLTRIGINKGVTNGQSKLNCEQVKEIIKLKDIFTQKKISEMYGISQSQVGSVIRGETYTTCFEPHHVKGSKNLKEKNNNQED